jgi:hypothetical protein
MSTITPPPVGGNEILELLSAESVEALATDDPQHNHLLYFAEVDTNSILARDKTTRAAGPFPTAKCITLAEAARDVIRFLGGCRPEPPSKLSMPIRLMR